MPNAPSSAAPVRLPPAATIVLAAAIGGLCGAFPLPYQSELARAVLLVFMNSLRLASLPIVFLAVCTTIMGMPSLREAAVLGRRTLGLTLVTTLLAASVALGLYVLIRPQLASEHLTLTAAPLPASTGYLEHLSHLVPSSLVEPFATGNVTAILLMAAAFGAAALSVDNRMALQQPLTVILAALLRIVRTITKGVPLIVWAGIVESYAALKDVATLKALSGYLLVVVFANLLQAIVVLPAVLAIHRIQPLAACRAMWPALTTAFFAKSSVATLPQAIRCAEEGLAVRPRVARFCFPLCTSINMNGCAAFILTTVLFVSEAHGRMYSAPALCGWVVLATLAALGNAGVPMGCYVIACSLLGTMGIPLAVMALIVPFYGFIDMLETAVNVWSDATVTLCINARTNGEVESTDAPAFLP